MAIQRLLIRLPNWLGDGLMARPLLHALRAGFPGAERVVVGPSGLVELLREEDESLVAHAWPAARGERGALASRLRREPADVALILPVSFSSAWFAWNCGARERVGYAAEGRSALLTRALRRPARGDRHVSEEYVALAEAIDAAVALPAALPVLSVSSEVRTGKNGSFAGVAGGLPYAILAPGAAYGPAKRWPVERFARLGERLRERGMTIVLCGAAADEGACHELASTMKGDSVDRSGRTSLRELAVLCAGARVVVSNDSGLAHLAGAVGAPTVVIFGSTSSAWTAPLGVRVRVVQRAPVCSPCFRRTCAIGYRCLAAVAVREVERACVEVAA